MIMRRSKIWDLIKAILQKTKHREAKINLEHIIVTLDIKRKKSRHLNTNRIIRTKIITNAIIIDLVKDLAIIISINKVNHLLKVIIFII